MFTFQVVAQQGLNFAGILFKEEKHIGGIGNNSNGFYIRIREKLTVSEVKNLMTFIESINSNFAQSEFELVFLNDEKYVAE